MDKKHIVKAVQAGGIAQEMQIEAGDRIVSINDTPIEDIFDYQFLIQDSYIEVLVEKPDGEEWLLEIDKDPDEDLGIEFESGLMDEYRRCHNRCIFCFIDQMPEGMRDTLYFKDDDSRLSFLQGNYVTLTNMSDHDIDRICRYRLSPINISFQTMNPELRCKMLNNRFAGEALKKADRLNEAGIRMNGQIVLCKGVNDGAELEYSIRELMRYLPNLESVSVVPVGLSRFREGLYPLEPFTAEDAEEVLRLIHRFQAECYEKYGTHFVHASDEWYVMAGEELPEGTRYDGYLQLENGVGMLRLLLEEFQDALSHRKDTVRGKDTAHRKEMVRRETTAHRGAETSREAALPPETSRPKTVLSMATGMLAYPYLIKMCREVEEVYPDIDIRLYAVRNDFFGERITVSGLLTGQDICGQLKGRELGQGLLLPQNVLRSGEDLFLDDLTVADLEEALQVPIYIVKSSGYDFLESILEAAGQGDLI
ncbi:MAG: DUF512 domain-containing protein [Muribaculum sp.]|nr:DUF512 domain-containing protein [Muribaculum sp.]